MGRARRQRRYGADIFHSAVQRAGRTATFAYFPANRALNEFKLHHYDCYLGGDAKAVAQAFNQSIISSKPFISDSLCFVYLENQTADLIPSSRINVDWSYARH